jgi:threonine dehydratase
MPVPDKDSFVEAQKRIQPYVHQTPVLTNSWLDNKTGAQLFFKCENFQKVGAFKIRGACNAVFQLTEEQVAHGVVTHSSGNHAQALALAAKIRGIKAYIVMPETAPEVKVAAVKGYGGEVIYCENSDSARQAKVDEVIAQTGATMVHPFNDYHIITGQGTAAMELMEDVRELDAIVTPVGGGGLLSGTCLAASYFQPSIDVYAGEPDGADDAFRSLQKGEIIPNKEVNTIADGLRTTIGTKNFAIIKDHVKSIITVTDDEIVDAMRMLWERMKLVVEPSGAVPLAAVLKDVQSFSGKRIGIILSGGNVDLKNLPF